jgi:hypothetical protein
MRGIMTRTLNLIVLAAAAALAGCNSEDHTIVSDPTGGPSNVAANADVKLPPAIVGSHKYRCKDNSLISIDWLSDGTANSARVTAGDTTVTVAQAEAGGPYTAADGASLTGDPQATNVTYKGQSCKR